MGRIRQRECTYSKQEQLVLRRQALSCLEEAQRKNLIDVGSELLLEQCKKEKCRLREIHPIGIGLQRILRLLWNRPFFWGLGTRLRFSVGTAIALRSTGDQTFSF